MPRSPIILSAAAGATLVLSGLVGTGVAQTPGPAEMPPAEFAAAEYVDSRGCVFARIEVGGRIDWVPRVGPDRQPLCGFPPSIVAGVPSEAPDATRPVQRAVIRAAEPPPPIVTPMAAPRRAAAPSMPAVPHRPRPAAVLAHVAAPPARVILPPKLSADDVRVRARCLHVSARAESYRPHSETRCHPGPAHPPALVHGARVPAAPATSAVTALRVDRPSVPPGYDIAWTDGRLNPYRGIRTETGEAEMRMIWTDTVPRRLVPAD